MTRVNALRAYKELVYDQWYRDVSVSRARSRAGRGQERRHSLTAASEQSRRPSTQQQVALSGTRSDVWAAAPLLLGPTPWTPTFCLCSSGKLWSRFTWKSFYAFQGVFFFFVFQSTRYKKQRGYQTLEVQWLASFPHCSGCTVAINCVLLWYCLATSHTAVATKYTSSVNSKWIYGSKTHFYFC